MRYQIPSFKTISKGRTAVCVGPEVGQLVYKYSRQRKRFVWVFEPLWPSQRPEISKALLAALKNGEVSKMSAIGMANMVVMIATQQEAS